MTTCRKPPPKLGGIRFQTTGGGQILERRRRNPRKQPRVKNVMLRGRFDYELNNQSTRTASFRSIKWRGVACVIYATAFCYHVFEVGKAKYGALSHWRYI